MQTPSKLWATLLIKHKIVRELYFPCPAAQVLEDGLRKVCKAFDISFPVVLQKHENELLRFSFTRFQSDDFLEPFPYTALSLTFIAEPDGDGAARHGT